METNVELTNVNLEPRIHEKNPASLIRIKKYVKLYAHATQRAVASVCRPIESESSQDVIPQTLLLICYTLRK